MTGGSGSGSDCWTRNWRGVGEGGQFKGGEVGSGKGDDCCHVIMGHFHSKGSAGRRVICLDRSSRAWLTLLVESSKYFDCKSLIVVE